LEGLARGDLAALDALVDVLCEELRLVAHRQRRRWRGDDTLGTTALLHETYLKLRQQKRIGTDSRDHFLALASRAMRHILSTYAKQRRRSVHTSLYWIRPRRGPSVTWSWVGSLKSRRR
jgi:hypothetical protein